MTTGELIRRLQDEDPSGNLPLSVGGGDVYFVERQAAIYDGCLQILVHDESKRDKCYSIVGAKVTSRGEKVRIHVMGVEDVIINNPEAPVDISELAPGFSQDRWKTRIEEWRKEYRSLGAPSNLTTQSAENTEKAGGKRD